MAKCHKKWDHFTGKAKWWYYESMYKISMLLGNSTRIVQDVGAYESKHVKICYLKLIVDKELQHFCQSFN